MAAVAVGGRSSASDKVKISTSGLEMTPLASRARRSVRGGLQIHQCCM